MADTNPPAPADAPIEADPDLTTDESDSTLGDDVLVASCRAVCGQMVDCVPAFRSRYTASLTSSIEAYPMENNRRYHAVPPNVKFEVDDCEAPWTFSEKFNVIHCRYLAAAIADWPKLVGQAYQFTKPGGYSEFQDYMLEYYSEDGTLSEDLSISKWITTLLDASRDFGRDPCPGPKLAGWMRDAGFQDVQETKYKLPIGPWPRDKHLKTVGAWNLIQIEEGLEAFTLRLFTQVLGWRTEEVQVLLANVRKDLRDPKIHAQFDFYVAYGQKPVDATG
ncbi:MAG: hypothetical protein Q9174_006647 [Haloplaca sp. 1 TL-2023]